MGNGKLPSGLIEAEELAEKLGKHKSPITADDLEELAHRGVIPCFWWNFEDKIHGPYFHVGPVKDWLIASGYFVNQPGEAAKVSGKPLHKRVEELEEAVKRLFDRVGP